MHGKKCKKITSICPIRSNRFEMHSSARCAVVSKSGRMPMKGLRDTFGKNQCCSMPELDNLEQKIVNKNMFIEMFLIEVSVGSESTTRHKRPCINEKVRGYR